MPDHMKLPPQWRAVEIARAATDESREDGGDELYEISFSSEEPYERWWGIEILGHAKGEVDLSWMTSGRAPLLVDHDARVDSMVGVVTKAWIEAGRGKALVRFGKGARAQEIKTRVDSGELSCISVGYRIEEMQMVKSQKDGPSTYRATKWKPHESSIVAIPADVTVGVGRSNDVEADAVRIIDSQPTTQQTPKPKGRSIMDEELKTAIEAAEARGLKGVWSQPAVKADDKPKSTEQILSDERKRVDEITKIAQRFNKGALGSEHIAKGTTSAEFNGIILNSVGDETFNERNMNAQSLGLNKKEAQQFRFTRLMTALANPTNPNMRQIGAYEMDVVNAASEKKGTDSNKRGVTIPIDVLRQPLVDQQRDLLVGTPTAGGHTVQTDLLSGDFISLLRNRTMVRKMGARFLTGLDGQVAIPRQTGGATGYWVAENSNLTESQQAFDQVTMTPKTFGAFTDMSRRLLLQSSLDVEALVRDDIQTVLGLGIDLGALYGTGAAGQPTGLALQAGINVVALGANGAVPTWANVVDMETQVAIRNADVGNMGYLTNAKVRGKLKTVEKAAASAAQFVWGESFDANGMNMVNGYRAGVSSQVPSNLVKGASGAVCSGMFFGNWSDLIIGQWSGIDLLVDPFTGGLAGTVRVIAFIDVDVGCRHGESFSYVADALTV
jgi:HK97 family phage major capsid protein